MINICSKPDNMSFFFTPFGGVKPVEMKVTHILSDASSGRQYFVFTHKNGSGRYFAREYLGDIKEKRFFTIKDKETLIKIMQSLRFDGLSIEGLDLYVAYD